VRQRISTASGSERWANCQSRARYRSRYRLTPSRALITPPLGSTLSPVQINNRANLPVETLTGLERELPRLGTLHEFVSWGSAMQPPVLLVETIALDEYTHDVIAPWRDDLTLVLGAT